MSRALWCVMNGRAAAPPAMACSVGPSTSTNPSPASVLRIDCTIFVRRRNRSHAFGVDQVEVAHPLPQLGIGQALVLLRRRLDALGEEMEVRGEDGQLADVRPLQLAVDADQVAQIELLGKLPVLFADLVHADGDLNPAGPVVQFEEPQLALAPLQHDPPGRADRRAVQLRRFARLGGRLGNDFALSGANRGDGRVVVEALSPGIDAEFLYSVAA